MFRLWFFKRFWRALLCLVWILFKLRGLDAAMSFLSRIQSSRLRRFIPFDQIEEFQQFVNDGFWMVSYNPCVQRSILSLFYLRSQDNPCSILVGAGNNFGEWSLHMWVVDAQGVNRSDVVATGDFMVLQRINFN